MAKKPKPGPKGRQKWPAGPKQPIVFGFRPVEYEVVPPERLKEWQESMIKQVGIPRKIVKSMGYTGHEVETYSPMYDD
jgi:hypothetical protein